MTMNTRLEQLQAWLPQEKEAALITAPYHLRYLTGFPSGDSYLFVTRDACYFLTDFRYIELARQTVRGAECVMITRLASTVAELAKRHGVCRVYVETHDTTVAFCERLQAQVGDVSVAKEAALDEQLARMRMVKTSEEIAKIEQAQAVAEAAFDHVLPCIREGVSERDIALELEFYMRKNGAERAAFDCIVVSGANSALPHGIPTAFARYVWANFPRALSFLPRKPVRWMQLVLPSCGIFCQVKSSRSAQAALALIPRIAQKQRRQWTAKQQATKSPAGSCRNETHRSLLLRQFAAR
jgi:Xaa-Pro aminopeptidase